MGYEKSCLKYKKRSMMTSFLMDRVWGVLVPFLIPVLE